MPIKPENRAKYPANWREIVARIARRSGNRCEWCGVRNWQLGGRLRDGRFLPALPLGERMLRLEWPKPGTESWCSDGQATERLRIIRVVLTVAHVDDPDPANCADENLAHLCQRCHNRHDASLRAVHASATRRARLAIGDLFAGVGGG